MGTIIDEEVTRKAVEAGLDTVMLKPDLREIARQVAIEGSYDGNKTLVDRIEAALRARDEQVWKDAYILVWGEDSSSELGGVITIEIYRRRILKKLKDASAIREGD